MREEDFTISFETHLSGRIRLSPEITFLYVMEGSMVVTVFDNSYILEKEDFIIINSNHQYRIITSDETALCQLRFRYNEISRQMGNKLVILNCNSTNGHDENYQYVREQMDLLLVECALDMDRMTFRKKSLIYNLIDFIISRFSIDEKVGVLTKQDLRIEKMIHFINMHYDEQISLTQLADEIYMSPSSASRFFKKTVGVNFQVYLNQIRLHHAVDRLFHTNDTITCISDDCGFTSISSFCRVFRETYGESPASYRRNAQQGAKTGKRNEKEIRKYLKKYTAAQKSKKQPQGNTFRIECDTQRCETLENPWSRAVFLGFAWTLTDARVQNQIRMAKQELGFSYGRINGIFSGNMMLRSNHDPHITNYYYLDSVLDFLTALDIRPIISLDNKKMDIIRGLKNSENDEMEEKGVFENFEEFLSILEDFMIHAVLRYGTDKVSGWIFDLWYLTIGGTVMGLQEDYTDAFGKVKRLIRSHAPGAQVGGWGLSSVEGKEEPLVSSILRKWSEVKERPDFISLYLFPYLPKSIVEVERGTKRQRNDLDFYANTIRKCRNKMDSFGFQDVPIYVMEWNISLTKRNFLHETCGKAAMLLRIISETNIPIGYGVYSELSDISGVGHDVEGYLFGGNGLINAYGGRKPSYYALMFLRKLHPLLLARNKHSLVTYDGKGFFAILCFHSSRIRYQYYRNSEDEIRIQEAEEIFETKQPVELTVQIDHMKNGAYTVKEYQMSPDKGSLLHEWLTMGYGERLDQEDYRYLREKAIPECRVGHLTVSSEKLILKRVLLNNEVRLILITL